MSGYAALASAYDELTRNVGYRRRAAWIHRCFMRNKIKGIVLDAGCGTGTLALLLAKRGYDLIAADLSEEMLGIAAAKAASVGADIQFIRQDLAELDLFGTVSGLVCMQDTLNHLGPGLSETIRRFGLFTEPGGVLICDINTLYKHAQVLADHTFSFALPGIECSWRNHYLPDEGRLAMTVEVTEKSGDVNMPNMSRKDVFFEYDIHPVIFENLLKNAGFEIIKKIDGESYRRVRPRTQRILYAAKKRSE